MSATFNALVRELAERIDKRAHANGLREARLLVEHVTGRSTAAQIVVADHPVPESEHAAILALLARREDGVPLARLLGKAAFWDFDVALNDAVLIPRDDTTALVEAALDLLPPDASDHVVDLGTGSGIILFALARERPHVTGLGVDRSVGALHQAEQNAEALGLSDRLSFVSSDWLDGVEGPLEFIVCNPPYIALGDQSWLDDEVRLHDPEGALFAGTDGLDAYRAVLPQCAAKLGAGGFALFEIGRGQELDVTALGERSGLRLSHARQDLQGVVRVLVFQKGILEPADM